MPNDARGEIERLRKRHTEATIESLGMVGCLAETNVVARAALDLADRLERERTALRRLLACYRTGARPSEALLDELATFATQEKEAPHA